MTTDPRIAVATAAGSLRATEVWTQDGWRKAPAQCTIVAELIKGADRKAIMAILTAWTEAYRATCRVYEDAALREAGLNDMPSVA